jgi:hypothetical protein
VVGAVAQAWEAFQQDAAAFPAHEAAVLQALKANIAESQP